MLLFLLLLFGFFGFAGEEDLLSASIVVEIDADIGA